MDNTQARRDNMEDNAEHELRDLQRLKVDYSSQQHELIVWEKIF